MKKLISAVIITVLMLSSFVLAAPDDEVEITGWAKHLGNTSVTESVENGEKIYTFGGVTLSFNTAGADVLPALKTLITGNDSITVKFSVDVKFTYADGYDGDDFTMGMLVRAVGVNSKIDTADKFKSIYTDKAFVVLNGDGVYGARLVSGESVYSDKWTTLEAEKTFTPNDINANLWQQLILCFDGMSNFEAVDKIHLKNSKLTVVSSKAGKGEVTVDLNKNDVSNQQPPVDNGGGRTYPMPEGNKLTDAVWAPAHGTATVEEKTIDGVKVYSVKNITSSYASPAINVYPTIKGLIGDKEEITVWIVLDGRVLSNTSNSHPFGMKLRPTGVGEKVETVEAFKENYTASTFKHLGDDGGLLSTVFSDGIFTDNWTRVEMKLTFSAQDFNDEFWTGWNLCFDMMKQYDDIYELQIKNTAIYLEDDYSTVYNEDNTSGTGTIYRPIGFYKYTATFAEVVDSQLPEGITPDTENNTDTGNDANVNNNADDGNNTVFIISAVAAAVVIVAVIGISIGVKAKKKGKNEK